MADKNYENITLYAALPILIYGDGYTAKILSQKPEKNQENEDVYEFILEPYDTLVKRYKIEPNSNGDVVYKVQLPMQLCFLLNPDPVNTRWLYLGTYNGQDSLQIRELKGLSQADKIRKLEESNRIKDYEIDVLKEKIRTMENNLPEYIKNNIQPFMEQIAPIVEKLGKTQKENN
jgi:hypothetical protein